MPSVAAPAIARLAILGAGADGTWLARRAALAGYDVLLEDLMPGKRRIAAERLAHDPVANAIRYASSVEEAARRADLVVDFVPDELESKLEIFSLLDRMAPPHTIFATPTSTLSIADLASCTYRPERCVSLRLPADLEEAGATWALGLVHAPGASIEAVQSVSAFWTSLGAQVSISIDRAALP